MNGLLVALGVVIAGITQALLLGMVLSDLSGMSSTVSDPAYRFGEALAPILVAGIGGGLANLMVGVGVWRWSRHAR